MRKQRNDDDGTGRDGTGRDGDVGERARPALRLVYSRGHIIPMIKNSGLTGPFPLSFEGIEDAVKAQAPGVYALGSKDNSGRFAIMSVGRSDTDVKQRLRECIGAGSFFKFDTFASEREAFEKECELFHKIRPPGNFVHPARPAATTLRCPHCRIFGQQT